ncbi:MAG: hypothetical protein AMJ72_12310 [Acidithiobacillales bacterium SM1_46]|nr:MAG: hypothetical protein AMJ72_12310 [Acidithiobacillales bacterium SM1_46]
MKQNVAEALHQQLEDMGCEVSLRDDYSGRGMYGETTYGISGDFSWCSVAKAWGRALEYDEDLNADDIDFTWDSMGLGIIIY